MLHLAFLWHMHQPYYVDATPAETGGKPTALMPWVRLHAAKGYLDMAAMVERFDKLFVSFNLTPVLLRQILELIHHETVDLWEEWTKTPADELSIIEKQGILRNFFSAHLDHMIRRYPRYAQLLSKRGERLLSEADITQAAARYTVQDYRDLQVWFNLTWCGYTACQIFPELDELKQKGRDFNEDDKQVVLQCQRQILELVLQKYRALVQSGRIELTTSPFYHPILPLIMDTQFTRRNMPQAALPNRFAYPEDAQAQIARACRLHESLFGASPNGMWPSEGSVCPELVPLLASNGIRWIATDSEILWRTQKMEATMPIAGNAIYQPYRVEVAQNGGTSTSVNVVFRDRGLSDFIGFVASRNPAPQAAGFFIQNLHRIADGSVGQNPLVSVVLDGENAWEHFPDGGEAFLECLYRAITSDPRIQTTTLSDYLEECPPKQTLHTLHTGSWINADFDIWIGGPEENRAWDLLGQARQVIRERINKGVVNSADAEAALEAIYAAEGSDWFWWYDEDFSSENKDLFDQLFRAHLRRAYMKAGLTPPAVLLSPIRRPVEARFVQMPLDVVEPILDGRVTTFFEWYQAGRFDPQKTLGAMYRAERLIKGFCFGFDAANFYFRIDFTSLPVNGTHEVKLGVITPTSDAAKFFAVSDWDNTGNIKQLQPLSDLAGSSIGAQDSPQFAFATVLEIRLPAVFIGVTSGQTINFFLQLCRDGIEVERYPSVGALPLMLPDENYEARNWRV